MGLPSGNTSVAQTAWTLNQIATDLGWAPLASPTFTGTVTVPTPFTLGSVSVLPTGTELNFVDGVTSAIQTQLDGKLATNGSAASLTNFPTFNQSTTGSAATLTTPRTINGVSFNGSQNVTVTAAGSTLSDPVTFANGGDTGSAATSATTGTMTVNMTTAVITITPTGACTFNASGGVTGQIVTFAITTSGTSSFVLTWGTNYRKTGTLATGTTSARFFSVTFRCINGTIWQEIARTAVQT